MTHFSSRFGPLSLGFEGEGELFELITANFEEDEAQPGDLCFRLSGFGDTLTPAPAATAVYSGHSTLTENSLISRVKGFDIQADVSAAQTTVTCVPWASSKRSLAYRIPRPLQRLLSSRYVTAAQMQALDFVFHVFYGQAQLRLLAQQSSLIHASSMVNADGEAVLIAGWGGVGKTSLTTYAYLQQGCTFLADDLSILGAGGQLWYNPMGIHVYPYNLTGFKPLETRLFQDRTALDRWHWHLRERLYGRSAVVRRVPPKTLWPVAGQAQLSTAIVLERWSGSDALSEPISAGLFARKAQHVLLHELAWLRPLIVSASAMLQPGWTPLLPAQQDFSLAVEQTYTDALKNVRLLQVRVPRSWTPVQLGDYIASELGWR